MIPVTMNQHIKNRQPSGINDCLGVVLAGGLSSRMGKDKASLMRKNISMLSYSKQLLTKVNIKNIVVSGNDHDVPDLFPHLGPMSGIYSVMQTYRPKALLILPVDLPLMNSESLAQLKQIGELSHSAVYFENNFLPLYLPVTAHVEQFFNEQLSSVTSNNSVKGSINNSVKKGPSMKALLKQIPSQAIVAKNPNALFNSNTPDEWQQAQSQFLKRNL